MNFYAQQPCGLEGSDPEVVDEHNETMLSNQSLEAHSCNENTHGACCISDIVSFVMINSTLLLPSYRINILIWNAHIYIFTYTCLD